ncbi:Crp/Fnr family transcriptional regulator [Roseovarius ramblicola]|uniref:Crp/Fnr family transcriptional regulator n=1 Tax=Roseovarius ramblicola TaxID=2022336 RepID=A0ABV5HZ61_9RHOB
MKSITDCTACPLRKSEVFRSLDARELGFVASMKSGEMRVAPRTRVLDEGVNSPHVFTVLSGWGLREKSLADGRRQILNFVLPGDLVGLQAAMFDAMDHSVEALTDMTLCVFPRREIQRLFHDRPSLGFTVVWHAARNERLLDATLMSVGRCTARERIARALLTIYGKARRIGLSEADGTLSAPITQQHLADALGLSLVHTNRTLKGMVADGLLKWRASRLQLCDEDRMRDIAQMEATAPTALPLI